MTTNEPDTNSIAVDSRFKKLLDEHHRLQKRIEELELELSLMQCSRSWRITAPLRLLRPWLGYLKSKFSLGRHFLVPRPFFDVCEKNEGFFTSGGLPQLLLDSSLRRSPVGWVEFSLDMDREKTPLDFQLYVDSGSGMREEDSVTFSLRNSQRSAIVKLPRFVRVLRLDPLGVGAAGHFRLAGLKVRELSWVEVYCRSLLRNCGNGGRSWFSALSSCLSASGRVQLAHDLLAPHFPNCERNKAYRLWLAQKDQVKHAPDEPADSPNAGPLISVLMPVYNTTESYLRKAIGSVRRQTYANWELCIADDASTKPGVRAVLEEAAGMDKRVRVTYRETNGHISESSNTALSMAKGEFVALMDHDDEIAPNALAMVVKAISEAPDLDLIYSDEDRSTKNGERLDPYLKAGWNEELLLSQNFVSHLGVYRASIAREIGGFRKGFEGSQDWDFVLRFSEKTTTERIKHIPAVLYSWRLVPGTVSFVSETKLDAFRAARQAVSEALTRRGVDGEVVPLAAGLGHRVMFTRDSCSRSLAICVLANRQFGFSSKAKAILEGLMATNMAELLVFHEPGMALEDLASVGGRHIEVQGSWPRAINLEMARGNFDEMVFLPSHMTDFSSNSLEELLRQIERKGVGVSGSTVWDNEKKLKFSWAVPGLGRKGYLVPHRGMSRSFSNGYMGLLNKTKEVAGVSWQGMAISKEAFNKAGGFGEQYGESYFDLDFCLGVLNSGLKVVSTPFSELSVSVSAEESSNSGDRQQFLKALAPSRAGVAERFYNPQLSETHEDFFFRF